MKKYLVGGAIRDELLGLPIKEKDWVVVGATPEDMLRLGYRPVGKDFPVFLHPSTQEEYALARTERKVKPGYTGFTFNSSPTVTLIDDLRRRDLTINAMAKSEEGELVDPYHGQQDLQNKIFRHVSVAFAEDPVRILRVARFAARFPDFVVAPETNVLMKKMVESGEVDALVAERVWKELERALHESAPERFFAVLEDCTALPKLFPVKIKLPLETKDASSRFAELLLNCSKEEVMQLCDRYRVPNDFRELALLLHEHYVHYIQFQSAPAASLAEIIFTKSDAFRREERFRKFLEICKTISGYNNDNLLELYQAAKNVDVKELLNQGLSGKQLAEAIKKARLENIERKLNQ